LISLGMRTREMSFPAAGGTDVGHVSVIGQSTGLADETEQSRLRIGPEPVRRLARSRRFDGSPPYYEEIVLPLSRWAPLPPHRQLTSDILELASEQGILLGEATERVRRVGANKTVAARLGMPEGGTVLAIDRVVHTAEGSPIEWRVTFRAIPLANRK
jgi:DNA-binding GntR family transcriptional regulator